MAYKYETQYNSPNYTPYNRVAATWGRPRVITAIAIHWWGDPNQNPSYNGVISYLSRPGGASAHFVATGTNRSVAQLINLQDASWATNSANPYTISIECDPRCRDSDYDVVAELIASIRSAYGDIPLVPHKQFVATACPGNYDLARLDRIAKTKDASGDWGDVKNKSTKKLATEAEVKAAYLEILERPADAGGIKTYANSKFTIAEVKADLLKSTEYKNLQERKKAEANKPKPVVTPPVVKEPPVVVEQPTTPVVDVETTTLLQDIKKLLEWLKAFLEARFK